MVFIIAQGYVTLKRLYNPSCPSWLCVLQLEIMVPIYLTLQAL